MPKGVGLSTLIYCKTQLSRVGLYPHLFTVKLSSAEWGYPHLFTVKPLALILTFDLNHDFRNLVKFILTYLEE